MLFGKKPLHNGPKVDREELLLRLESESSVVRLEPEFGLVFLALTNFNTASLADTCSKFATVYLLIYMASVVESMQ